MKMAGAALEPCHYALPLGLRYEVEGSEHRFVKG
jgi:hypothetical protein